MLDVISPIINIAWPFIVALLGILGVFVYGRKKKAEGSAAEQERARDARDAAAREAAAVREKAKAKPIEQQRQETSKWER